MTAEQELAGYGYWIRQNKGGALRLYTAYGVTDSHGQLRPGECIEVGLASVSPLADLARRAFAERGVDWEALK